MITDEQAEKALDYLVNSASKLSQAKADYSYVDDFKRVLKAQLMKEHPEMTAAGQEREAYSDPRYNQHLHAIKTAEAQYLHIQYLIDAAKVRIDVWRTQSSNERAKLI